MRIWIPDPYLNLTPSRGDVHFQYAATIQTEILPIVLPFRTPLASSGDEHRDQHVGDRENVDQHDPEHSLHDAAHLTAIGLTVDH